MKHNFKPRYSIIALAVLSGFSAPAYAIYAEQEYCLSDGLCYTTDGPWSYYSIDPAYDSFANYQTASSTGDDSDCGGMNDSAPVDPDSPEQDDPVTLDDINTGLDAQVNQLAQEIYNQTQDLRLDQQQANEAGNDFDNEVNLEQQSFRQSEIEDEDNAESNDDLGTAYAGPDNYDDTLLFDPVSTASGAVVQKQTDYRARGLFPVWFARNYISTPGIANARSVMPLGQNWRSNYDRVMHFGTNQIVILRPNGTTYTFNPTGSGGWTPSRNIPMQLVTGTYNTWILTTPYGDKEVYDQFGKLISISNRQGVTQNLQYSSPLGHITSVTDAGGRTLQFNYNNAGLLQSVVAPGNATYSFTYNNNASLTSVTYPDGTSKTYVYENAQLPNALTGIIDEANTRIASWSYDSQGRAISNTLGNNIATGTIQYGANQTTATLPTGATKSLQLTTVADGRHLVTAVAESCSGCATVAVMRSFDANGLLQSVTDANGVTTTYARDAQGREVSRTLAANSSQPLTIARSWNAQYMLETGTSAAGMSTKNTFDAAGNQLSHTESGGALTHTWQRAYNAQGQVTSATNSEGQTTTFTYDGSGNLATKTNALGQKTTFNSWDVNGRLLSYTDPNGLVTQFQYDLRGRLVSKTVGSEVATATWTPFGRLATLTTPDGVVHSYAYDSAHRMVQASDSTGRKAVYTLNALGQRTNTSVYNTDGSLARSSSATYDGLGHLTQTISGTGQVTNYQHDANGRVTAVVDPLARTSQLQYDARGRLAAAIDPNQGVTRISYDTLSRPLSVTDPRGVATGYGYDTLGELVQVQSPDAGTRTRQYDAGGMPTSSLDAMQQRTLYSFDPGQRVKSVKFADGNTVTLTYDQGTNGIGRLTNVAESSGSTGFQYDAYGHISQQQSIIGAGGISQTTLRSQYGYDSAGRLVHMVYPSGTQVDYAYGSDGRVSQVSVNGSVAISGITYDGAGAPAMWNYANGQQVILAFDYAGRQVQNSLYTIGYDNGDRVTSMTASAGNAVQRNKQFGYDVLDHLTSFSDGRLPMAWTYDANGNRVTDQTGTPVDTYQVDTASNRLLSINEAAQPPAGAFTVGFTYDANGDVVSRGSMAMTYDAAGRMTSPGNTRYVYNFAGQRLAKYGSAFEDTVADPFVSQTGVTATDRQSRLFAYGLGGQQIGEYFGRGQKVEETVYLGSIPLLVLKGANVFYVKPDHLGTPRQIADSHGNTVWSWEIAAFGSSAPTNQFGAGASGFVYNMRFPGQYYDLESGFLYNWHRYYDGQTGRYLQSDPLGIFAGINTYAYVNGNPVDLVDLLGLMGGGGYSARGSASACASVSTSNNLQITLGIFDFSSSSTGSYYAGLKFPPGISISDTSVVSAKFGDMAGPTLKGSGSIGWGAGLSGSVAASVGDGTNGGGAQASIGIAGRITVTPNSPLGPGNLGYWGISTPGVGIGWTFHR